MANGLGGSILPQIQRIFQSGTLAGMTDGQLLERFAASHDEASFEALLARYGPLVLSVCRNLLHDRDDVDDAFQATFFVVVRKAGSIRLQGSLGPWIYAVAYRVANRARANRRLRTTRESTVAEWDPAAPAQDLDRADVSPLLHDELARLPERLRAPIVLCYFQGLTHEIAAQQLQWPVGTVRSRMARGRDLLRSRLVRKGVVPSAGFLVAASRQASAACLRRALSQETTQAALRIAAGRTVGAALSNRAALLMEGVLNAMWLTKLKTAAGAAIAAGLIVTGMVAIAAQPPSDKPAPPVSIESSAERNDTAAPQPTTPTINKTYYVGDLLVAPSAGPIQVDRIHTRSVKADFAPLIKLLTTTVAPGTWKSIDDVKPESSTRIGPDAPPHGDDSDKIGAITPYYLSISLIIRHTAEAHDEIAVLFRQLRSLIHQRDETQRRADASREIAGSSEPPAPDPAHAPSDDDATRANHDPARELDPQMPHRIQKRIDDLQRELDELVRVRRRLQSSQFQERLAPSRNATPTSVKDH